VGSFGYAQDDKEVTDEILRRTEGASLTALRMTKGVQCSSFGYAQDDTQLRLLNPHNDKEK
jgi:hypothetical protein